MAAIILQIDVSNKSALGSNWSSDNFGWSSRPFVALDGSYADKGCFDLKLPSVCLQKIKIEGCISKLYMLGNTRKELVML